MIDRCYKEKCEDYKYYGAIGITVCDKWLKFDEFLEDIDYVIGFDLQEIIDGKIQLDKDKISSNSKQYNLKNCSFISSAENKKYKPRQQKDICGISPKNEVFIFRNISDFAKKYDLRQGSISECLNGKLKTHKDWRFLYRKECVETIERIG